MNLTLDNKELKNVLTIKTATDWYEYIYDNGATTKHLTILVDRANIEQSTTIENIFLMMVRKNLFFKVVSSGTTYENEYVLTDINDILNYIAEQIKNGTANRVYLSSTKECIRWSANS